MDHFQKPLRIKTTTAVKLLLLTIAAMLIVGGLALTPFDRVASDMNKIYHSSGTLFTDYFVVGSAGAALINSGTVMLFAIAIIHFMGLKYNGLTIASVMIVGAFALFGKNPLNILPILTGNWLYSTTQKDKWGRYIYIGLFSTCLAPFVSQMTYSLPFTPLVNIICASVIGVALGFLIPPFAAHTATVHFGYDLFNVGFAAGFIALIAAAFLRGFGLTITPPLLWSKGIDVRLATMLYVSYGILALVGFILSEKNLKPFLRIHRHPGRAIADFIIMDGVGPTMINMALVGVMYLSYVLAIGGDLNGPVLGAILTVTGFAAFGMHIKNCLPTTLGVYIACMVMSYSPTDPAMQLAAIFCAGLAPIAGQFGPIYGIIAGIIHCAVVANTSTIYSGLNLYNNGFAAGIVAMFMIPLLESIEKEQ